LFRACRKGGTKQGGVHLDNNRPKTVSGVAAKMGTGYDPERNVLPHSMVGKHA